MSDQVDDHFARKKREKLQAKDDHERIEQLEKGIGQINKDIDAFCKGLTENFQTMDDANQLMRRIGQLLLDKGIVTIDELAPGMVDAEQDEGVLLVPENPGGIILP